MTATPAKSTQPQPQTPATPGTQTVAAGQLKYVTLEVERRWLVRAEELRQHDGAKYREIEDLYVQGSALRLRMVRDGNQPPVYKLCKKYGKPAGSLSETVTNIYLSESEYKLLRGLLPGQAVSKRRYAVAGGALDVHANRGIPAIFEMEFSSEAAALVYVPPNFVAEEVTRAQAFSGAALASVTLEPAARGG